MSESEPSNAEIARRLDSVVRQLDTLTRMMVEEQRRATEMYVLKEVYVESSKRWQAEVVNVKEDLNALVGARRQLQAVTVSAGLSGVVSMVLWLVQTTRGT